MSVIYKFFEFWTPFSRKTELAQSQNISTTLTHTLLRKIEQICEIFLICKKWLERP